MNRLFFRSDADAVGVDMTDPPFDLGLGPVPEPIEDPQGAAPPQVAAPTLTPDEIAALARENGFVKPEEVKPVAQTQQRLTPYQQAMMERAQEEARGIYYSDEQVSAYVEQLRDQRMQEAIDKVTVQGRAATVGSEFQAENIPQEASAHYQDGYNLAPRSYTEDEKHDFAKTYAAGKHVRNSPKPAPTVKRTPMPVGDGGEPPAANLGTFTPLQQMIAKNLASGEGVACTQAYMKALKESNII